MKIDQISENDYSEPQNITGVSKSNQGITIIEFDLFSYDI